MGIEQTLLSMDRATSQVPSASPRRASVDSCSSTKLVVEKHMEAHHTPIYSRPTPNLPSRSALRQRRLHIGSDGKTSWVPRDRKAADEIAEQAEPVAAPSEHFIQDNDQVVEQGEVAGEETCDCNHGFLQSLPKPETEIEPCTEVRLFSDSNALVNYDTDIIKQYQPAFFLDSSKESLSFSQSSTEETSLSSNNSCRSSEASGPMEQMTPMTETFSHHDLTRLQAQQDEMVVNESPRSDSTMASELPKVLDFAPTPAREVPPSKPKARAILKVVDVADLKTQAKKEAQVKEATRQSRRPQPHRAKTAPAISSVTVLDPPPRKTTFARLLSSIGGNKKETTKSTTVAAPAFMASPADIAALAQLYPSLSPADVEYLSSKSGLLSLLLTQKGVQPTSKISGSSSRPTTPATKEQAVPAFKIKQTKDLKDLYADLAPGELEFLSRRPDALAILSGASKKDKRLSTHAPLPSAGRAVAGRPPPTIETLKKLYPNLTDGELIFLSKRPDALLVLQHTDPRKSIAIDRPQLQPAVASIPAPNYLKEVRKSLSTRELEFLNEQPETISMLQAAASKKARRKSLSSAAARDLKIRISGPIDDLGFDDNPWADSEHDHDSPRSSQILPFQSSTTSTKARPSIGSRAKSTPVMTNLSKCHTSSTPSEAVPTKALRRISSHFSLHTRKSTHSLRPDLPPTTSFESTTADDDRPSALKAYADSSTDINRFSAAYQYIPDPDLPPPIHTFSPPPSPFYHESTPNPAFFTPPHHLSETNPISHHRPTLSRSPYSAPVSPIHLSRPPTPSSYSPQKQKKSNLRHPPLPAMPPPQTFLSHAYAHAYEPRDTDLAISRQSREGIEYEFVDGCDFGGGVSPLDSL